jgi:hypothetical protein
MSDPGLSMNGTAVRADAIRQQFRWPTNAGIFKPFLLTRKREYTIKAFRTQVVKTQTRTRYIFLFVAFQEKWGWYTQFDLDRPDICASTPLESTNFMRNLFEVDVYV